MYGKGSVFFQAKSNQILLKHGFHVLFSKVFTDFIILDVLHFFMSRYGQKNYPLYIYIYIYIYIYLYLHTSPFVSRIMSSFSGHIIY